MDTAADPLPTLDVAAGRPTSPVSEPTDTTSADSDVSQPAPDLPFRAVDGTTVNVPFEAFEALVGLIPRVTELNN